MVTAGRCLAQPMQRWPRKRQGFGGWRLIGGGCGGIGRLAEVQTDNVTLRMAGHTPAVIPTLSAVQTGKGRVAHAGKTHAFVRGMAGGAGVSKLAGTIMVRAHRLA